MVDSINSSRSAAVGRQEASKGNAALDRSHQAVAAGDKVTGSRNDAATLEITKQAGSKLASSAAVQGNLAFGEATTSAAIAAGTQISNLLTQAKGLAVQATQSGLGEKSRQVLQTEFGAIAGQINSAASAGGFGNTNLIQPGANNLELPASENGDAVIVGAHDLSASGLGIDGRSLWTVGGAEAAARAVDSAIGKTSSALSSFSSAVERIRESGNFSATLANSVRQGVGDLVEADLGSESAKLLASEVKQRLGLLSLSIGNASPRNIASLFE